MLLTFLESYNLIIKIRELQFLLVGILFTAGVIFISIGLIYKVDPVLVLQSVTISPVFNIPTEVNRDFAIDIIDRTNIDRKKVGLSPLKENSALSYAAYLRAKDILDNQDFSHVATKSGEIKAQRAIQIIGYRYSEAGENLAMGIDDPNEVVAQWIASPEHKANLFSKTFNETGAAVLNGEFQGQKDTYMIVQLFGAR